DLDYPFHDRTITVTHCGRICLGKRKINLSTVFAGQNVGVKEISDRIWLVSFMHYDLGFFDHETSRLEPVDNTFEPKVLPMSPEETVTYVPGMDLDFLARPAGFEPTTPRFVAWCSRAQVIEHTLFFCGHVRCKLH